MTGQFSFVRIDAACATLLAVERGRPGIYNIVDSHCADARVVAYLAEQLVAKNPCRVPGWLAEPFIGEIEQRAIRVAGDPSPEGVSSVTSMRSTP